MSINAEISIKNFKIANKYFNEGNFLSAVEYYDKTIDSGYIKWHIYYNRSLANIKLGNLKNAISDLETVILLDDDNFDSLYLLGKIYEACSTINDSLAQKAIEYFSNAISVRVFINKTIINCRFSRAGLYCKCGNYEEAIDDYSFIINNDKSYVEAYINRGMTHFFIGNDENALSDFSKAADLKPGILLARYNLFLAEYCINDTDISFDKILELEAVDFTDHIIKANAYKKTGDHEAAIKEFSKAIDKEPSLPQLYYERATEFQMIGKIFEARNDLKKYKELYCSYDLQRFQYNLLFERLITKRFSLLFLIIAIIIVIFLKPIKCSYYQYMAQYYYEQNKYSDSADYYQKLISIEPDKPRHYYMRSNAYLNAQKFKDAYSDINKAIKLDSDPVYLIQRAKVRLSLKNVDLAISDLKNFVGLKGESNETDYLLGSCYLENKDYNSSLGYFNKLIGSEPENALYYFKRSEVYSGLNDDRSELSDLDKSIQLDPSNSEAYKKRSFARKKIGEIDGALNDINESIKNDPGKMSYYSFRAALYYDQDDFPNALNDLNKAILLSPDNYEAYLVRGYCNLFLDRFIDSAKDFKIAINGYPIFSKLITVSVFPFLYYKMRHYDQLITKISKIIEANPDEEFFLYIRSKVHEYRKDYKAALEDLNIILKNCKDTFKVKEKIAAMYKLKGEHSNEQKDFKNAISIYEEIIEYKPKYYTIILDCADSYLKMNDIENCIKKINSAIELKPNDVIAYRKRALVYLSRNDNINAVSDYNKIIGINKNSCEDYNGRGISYMSPL